MVKIILDLSKPNTQTIKVSIRYIPSNKFQRLIIPAWTPGSYTIRDHSQHIYNLCLTQGDSELPLERESSCKWIAELNNLDEIYLSYDVITNDLSVRTSYLDPDFGSLCLSSLIILIDEHRWHKHKISFIKKKSWNLFIPNTQGDEHLFDNYDQLIDSPVHCGKFNSHIFYVKNKLHELVLIGEDLTYLPSTFIKDLSKICNITCELMKEDPASKEKYQIILILLDNAYGGLEHDNSSVMHFDRSLVKSDDGYRKLLQLIGHEYLHQWNVRRLRPKEYSVYDYTSEVISEGLWFAEGLTSYFDVTLPYVSRLSKKNDLYNDFSILFTRYFNTPGRYIQSLSDSSKEAWIKLYKSKPFNLDNQISYYCLGALVALSLDIFLRQKNSSLSQLLREMWHDFGSKELGYTRNDIIEKIKIYDKYLSYKLIKWLDKPNSLEIEEIIRLVGLELIPDNNEIPLTGISFEKTNNLIISRVERNSPAEESGLIIGDELIAISDKKLVNQSEFTKIINTNNYFKVTFFRRNNLRNTDLYVHKNTVDKWKLSECNVVTPSQRALREKWLCFL